MKSIRAIIILICMIPGLLSSGRSVTKADACTGKDSYMNLPGDVTGLTDYLKVDSFRLDIIPPSSGVRFYRDGILFLSNTKFEGKMLPKHVSFGSIEAYTAIVKDTSLGMHILFSPSSSFSFPCEATTFSSDYKIMYFTKITKKAKREKIYRAVYKADEKGVSGWIADENPLEFCSGDNIYTHPALSADGNLMIFSSDMEGGTGGLDLYLVKKDGGKWSKPINLGKSINTKQSECFPYFDHENNLYFSSDGLGGFGGYDIFTSKFNGTKWDNPINLSRTINSGSDDIAFCIDKGNERDAFYTKRQIGGKGEMSLIRVTLKQKAADNIPLTISYIFNGKPISATESVAATTPEEKKPTVKDSVSTTLPAVTSEVKSEEKKPIIEPVKKSTDAKVVTIKATSEIPDALKNVVVYRVQFLTTSKPRTEKQIVINGVAYQTFGYFYLGAYRYTIGEFTTLAPARELQSLCRKSGYPQAFVAAFKNETRSLDLSLFK